MSDYTCRGIAVPDSTMAALTRYVEHGVPTGDFLHAVLTNNLFVAVGRVDGPNLHALHAIVAWVYNEAPGACHGSAEKVAAWIENHRQEIADLGEHHA